MSANPKFTEDRGIAAPTSERRPSVSGRQRITSDAIRTMRYDFQVDAGEAYLEDMSWRPFTNLKRRPAEQARKLSPPRKVLGGGR
jgi:hypothetical protein